MKMGGPSWWKQCPKYWLLDKENTASDQNSQEWSISNFPPQPHQKYYITQYEELGFSSLTQMQDDKYYQFSPPSLVQFYLQGWENVPFELGSERVKLDQRITELKPDSSCIIQVLTELLVSLPECPKVKEFFRNRYRDPRKIHMRSNYTSGTK